MNIARISSSGSDKAPDPAFGQTPQNRSSFACTVDDLSHDENADVRSALAESPLTGQLILEALLDDENPYVQARARQTQVRLGIEKGLLA